MSTNLYFELCQFSLDKLVEKFPYLTNIYWYQKVYNWSDAPSTINGKNQNEADDI